VLVCRTTLPSWTSLFRIAGAVVTDSGGALSHAAIVAREYGLPCVVATRIGTVAIRDGQMVTVDGGAGTVRLY
jgi:pyruvate,water dikinase